MACLEYIINIHGGGRLTIKPGEKNYADYLYWLHNANGSLQPSFGRAMSMQFAGIDEDNNHLVRTYNRIDQELQFMNQRLKDNTWLAGDQFTAADVMTVWSLAGMREFFQLDISQYGHILAYLQRVKGREGYRKAMAKGDPDVNIDEFLQGPPPPKFKALRR